jgi:CBS domain-containing protein
MPSKLVTLSPEMDVFDAIGRLLKNRISGAPVVDAKGDYLGVFSEKYSMSVLIQGAYEQLPSTGLRAFMNTDPDRTITETTDVLRCAEIFLKTIFRRLPVLRGRKVVGQVSRRDVLRHEQDFELMLRDHGTAWFDEVGSADRSESSQNSALANEVSRFMDTDARTITEEADLLGIAQIFLLSPYRRLPVLRGQKLIGQISRRDLLAATHRLIEVAPLRERATLYLSALSGSREAVFG